MADEKNNNTDMLIDLVKSVAVLTSEFKNFKNERSEDNNELKEAIKEVKADVKDLRAEMDKVKTQPLKDKASKWESLVKLIFEGIVSACLLVVLIKIGLK